MECKKEIVTDTLQEISTKLFTEDCFSVEASAVYLQYIETVDPR